MDKKNSRYRGSNSTENQETCVISKGKIRDP